MVSLLQVLNGEISALQAGGTLMTIAISLIIGVVGGYAVSASNNCSDGALCSTRSFLDGILSQRSPHTCADVAGITYTRIPT